MSMDTPICDFVREYANSNALRLHMPGHKGKSFLGMESQDITEIDGADSLYEAADIIARSEKNASQLFGCRTYYSTEGSSQCIRAMLYLCLLYAEQCRKKPVIAAGRNVHKTFLSAAALLDLDVVWLYPTKDTSYLSCEITAEALEAALLSAPEMPAAVYVTSPDYLGKLTDISGISEVCHRHGILLLVDNAHGAYLKFLEPSQHPMDLGADLCCDSAHKTLPVLTGGAYLHLSDNIPENVKDQTKNALALFGSTSPSYLILQSLDAANAYLADYKHRLGAFVPVVSELKTRLTRNGYLIYGDEPLKITIGAKKYGYAGKKLAQLLSQENLVCEFSDPDFLVLMVTPETGEAGLKRLENKLLSIPPMPTEEPEPPSFRPGKKIMTIREAMLSPSEIIPVSESLGRILAAATVGCPPAVPILICGEMIDAHAVSCFEYYGVDKCTVVRETGRRE